MLVGLTVTVWENAGTRVQAAKHSKNAGRYNAMLNHRSIEIG
jgi:hypothetical protein